MADMGAIERQLAVHDLNARYVEAIDEGRFEDWPDDEKTMETKEAS